MSRGSIRLVKITQGKGKPHKTMIYFRPEQWVSLLALSEKTGAPISELVRRAVDLYMKEQKQDK
jgi:hypothetical protein